MDLQFNELYFKINQTAQDLRVITLVLIDNMVK